MKPGKGERAKQGKEGEGEGREEVKFIELADEIPYVRVTSFKVKQVVYANEAFEIKLDRKCDNLPEEKEYSISRKVADLRWLIDQLRKESPWVAALPFLPEPNWSLTDVISMADQDKTKLRKWHGDLYLCRVA